jgi:hypothetical protein
MRFSLTPLSVELRFEHEGGASSQRCNQGVIFEALAENCGIYHDGAYQSMRHVSTRGQGECNLWTARASLKCCLTCGMDLFQDLACHALASMLFPLSLHMSGNIEMGLTAEEMRCNSSD